MAFKHVWAPTKGMVTNAPSTVLDPEASTNIEAMVLKDGVASSDTGHVDFPTVAATATNELNGAVMRFDQFYKTDGTTYPIALTVKHAYLYNTSTSTWDVITQGTAVEDCEDAWTAASDVTCTADGTVKLRGTYSAKQVIAAGFTTGIVAYEDMASTLDLSGAANTHIGFWIKASAAVASDVLRFRVAEDIGGAATNTYNDFTIPALVADTWQHVSLKTKVAGTGTWPADFDSVDSVALVAQSDPGAITVYIDDVRTTKEFTGDEDDAFSVDTLNDTFLMTNGLDQPQKYTGTGTLADLTTTLAAGSITTSEIVMCFKDHVVFMNNTENGADCPQRVSWGNIGLLEDQIGGTAGYQDLVDDESWIIAALKMGESTAIIYKERSIVMMTWVGGQTPLRFDTISSAATILGKRSVVDVNGPHIVMGNDKLYACTYSTYYSQVEIKAIDEAVRGSIYSGLNNAMQARSFLRYDERANEVQAWIPTTTDYPDTVWCLNVEKGNWYRKTRTMMGYGEYAEQATLTIGDLTGTIGEQQWKIGDATTRANFPITLVGDHNGKIYKLYTGALNNDGIAITNVFETPDFTLPDTEEYQNKFMRVPLLLYEAYGQSVTTSWSDDGGRTWNPTQGGGNDTQALTDFWDMYQQDFDCVVRKIRFRFRNITVSSGFHLRYYGFEWRVRSERR